MADQNHNKYNPDRKIMTLNVIRRVTAVIILLENLTAGLWRLACWIMFFCGLWFLKIPTALGSWAEPLILLIFLAGGVWIFRQDAIGTITKFPTKNNIDRRIEESSHLSHRPLAQEKDILSNPVKKDTRILWDKRLQLFRDALDKLTVPSPKAFIARKDPYAIRMAAILFFLITIMMAGPTWTERLKTGLTPFSFQIDRKDDKGITIWFTPPEYTHLDKIILQGSGKRKDILSVPAGSTLKIRITDGIGHPYLVMGNIDLPLKYLGENTYGIETKVMPATEIAIKQSLITRASVPIQIIEDSPPIITLNQDVPVILEKGQLQFDLIVQDDYGVKDLNIRVNIDPAVNDKPLGSPYLESRPVMSLPKTETGLKPVYDLTWHTWAGLPSIITLEVTDDAGHKSSTGPITMALPERLFRHPVSKTLVDERKKLAWNPQGAARESSDEITMLLNRPDLYQHDIIAFLVMRSMASRLYYNNSTNSVISVIETLWDTALRIEEGNISIASRNLREALQNLESTLNRPGVTQEEIARAMQDVREAMAAYFMEVAREMQKQLSESGMETPDISSMAVQSFTPEDLQSFLDQLQSEAFSGEMGTAREMLSQLQKMMDGLGSSMDMKMPQDMQFMMESVSELQKLIKKQEELLAETRKLIPEGVISSDIPQTYGEILPFDLKTLEQWNAGEMPPFPQLKVPPFKSDKTETPQFNTKKYQGEQDALRYILGELMLKADEQLGDIPDNMEKSEREMRLSATQLGKNKPAVSIPHQEKAIEYLQESQQQMSKQLQDYMKQMLIFSFGGGGQIDPLGRPYGEGKKPGWWPGSKVKIPDETERKRVREIQELLRERSGERDRPDYELDYYNRLLKKF